MDKVNIGPWDGVLIAGVALQATVLAFVREPRWKALLYSFPIPFTIANLALGRETAGGRATAVINIDGPMDEAVIERIRAIPHVISARMVEV